jgi:hypothetical protein
MVLCGVLWATAASASEQEPSPELEARRTFVGLEAVALSRGLLAVDGERVLSPKLSVRLGVRLGARLFETRGDQFPGDTSSFLVGLVPGLRYYLTGAAPDGLWVGSQAELLRQGYDTGSGTPSQVTARNRAWSVGVATLVGYSMVVTRGLTVQAGVGLEASYSTGQLTVRNTTVPGEESESTFQHREWGVSEKATLAVGWAF